MKNLLEFLLIHLVDHPDEIVISEEQDNFDNAVFRVNAHPDDMGQIIGRGGSRIRAIRKIVQMKATQLSQNFKIYLWD